MGRPTLKQIRAFYADDIKNAKTSELFVIVRGELRPKYLNDALKPMAQDELRARGYMLTTLAALNALL